MLDASPATVNRDLSRLCHVFAGKVEAALVKAKAAGYAVAIFEGYRSPARQDFLYAQGRNGTGKLVTNARAWESAHQAGLAVDIAGYKDGHWSWDFDAHKVACFFIEEGLETLAPFEVCHFQMTAGLGGRLVAATARDYGLNAAWREVQAKEEGQKIW